MLTIYIKLHTYLVTYRYIYIKFGFKLMCPTYYKQHVKGYGPYRALFLLLCRIVSNILLVIPCRLDGPTSRVLNTTGYAISICLTSYTWYNIILIYLNKLKNQRKLIFIYFLDTIHSPNIMHYTFFLYTFDMLSFRRKS